MRTILPLAIALALPVAAHAAAPGTPARIEQILTPARPQLSTQTAMIDAATAFYDFWNTGDQATLARAIAPSFVDHTPPPGRQPGPRGPFLAAQAFLGAVPDMQVTVEQMIIAGPYVTVHMHFDGHFTGEMSSVKGHGQPIHFIATDLLKITDGRITDNWHIEDNLTLLTQMGIVKRAS